MSGVAALIVKTLKSVAPLQKSEFPPILRRSTGNLYEVLSRKPTGCLGMEVHQTRWNEKNIADSYWVVTRAQFKNEGKHGKAWGKLFWRGLSWVFISLPSGFLNLLLNRRRACPPAQNGYVVL
jgi:small subunit ribosomal protein S34